MVPRETAYGPVRGYVATRSAGGTKTDTPLIETPQSISVITRDQMDAQAVQSVSQALNYTAGVVAQPRGSVNGYYEFPFIRGFAPTNFLYLDGMQLLGASAGLQIEPYGLERIEVIKGPASILYGQGPPSGIISMISKRPTEVPFREILYQGGTWDRKQGAFDVSGPVDGEGKVLYRLVGLARDSGTQVDFTEDNRLFIAPAVTWRPTVDTTLTILGQYQKAESGFFNFLPARGTFLPNPNGVISTSFYAGDPNFNTSTITNSGITYLFEHRFNEMFTVRQNYRRLEISVDADNIFSGVLAPNLRTLSRFAFLNRDVVKGDTLDNQLQAKINTWAVQHTVLWGLDLQRLIEDHQTGNGAAPTIDIFNPYYFQKITPPRVTADTYQIQRQTGFYVQDQMKLDRWVLLVGARGATSRARHRFAHRGGHQRAEASARTHVLPPETAHRHVSGARRNAVSGCHGACIGRGTGFGSGCLRAVHAQARLWRASSNTGTHREVARSSQSARHRELDLGACRRGNRRDEHARSAAVRPLAGA